jgi:hypothetical protein
MANADLRPLPQEQVHEIAVLATKIQEVVNETATCNAVAINAVFSVAAGYCLDMEHNLEMSREEVINLVTSMMRSMVETLSQHVTYEHTH